MANCGLVVFLEIDENHGKIAILIDDEKIVH
jgi:hypothetical protein